MGLSKHAQEEVNEKIKELLLAYAQGIKDFANIGTRVIPIDMVCNGFKRYLEINYTTEGLGNYAKLENCYKWLRE